MHTNGDRRLSAVMAVMVGISYIAVGVIYFLLPEEQQPGAGVHRFLTSIEADGSALSLALYWSFAVGALLAIGVVFAVSGLVTQGHEILVRWASTLAIIGFAVVAVQFIIFQQQVPDLAHDYGLMESEFVGVGTRFVIDDAGERVAVRHTGILFADPGVQAGDVLLGIDGQAVTKEMSDISLVEMLNGPLGSQVVLRLRTGDGGPRDVAVTRRQNRVLEVQARRAVTAIGLTELDQHNWIGFGTVGLWFLVVNWLARTGRRLPTGLTYVGLGVGIAYMLVVAGGALDQEDLIAIAAGVGAIILAPVWWIWTGVFFWRSQEA